MDCITELLTEGVLNDDVMYVAPEGYRFKGGYAAIVEYYTYASTWHNNKHIRRFRTLEAAERFITKNNLRKG